MGWSHDDSDKTIYPIFPIYIASENEHPTDVSFRFNAIFHQTKGTQHGFLKRFVDYTPSKGNDLLEY
jgi:hypothetical protein